MIVFGIILIGCVAIIALYMQQTMFGRLPRGERMNLIRQSPQYKNGKFVNLEHTPDFTNGANLFTALRDFLFVRNSNARPPLPLPAVKTNLLAPDPGQDILVWFGHSSYFMQVDGKTFLVDPVFSGSASPIRNTTRSFPGSDAYSVADLPHIDYLLLTHDHWDHLDYHTIKALRERTGKIITSLGVGAHLERWGFDAGIVAEYDWNSTVTLGGGFTMHTTPARHFSGRGIKRAQTIWSSFVLITPTLRLFLGGDSGYGAHFADIGKQFGPFDLAVLECGQYNLSWQNIHMLPEETVQAAIDLQARQLLPVHWAKFKLSMHDWNEPIRRVTAAASVLQMPLLTPKIGEPVHLKKENQFGCWWELKEM